MTGGENGIGRCIAYEGPDATEHPADRVGNPMDIAHAVQFLCSDKAGSSQVRTTA